MKKKFENKTCFCFGIGKKIIFSMVESGFDLIKTKKFFFGFRLLYFQKEIDFTIKLVKSEQEMKSAYFIRESIFLEEGGLNYEEGGDQYDNNSFHFLFLKKNVPIGYMRLIKIYHHGWDFQGYYKPPKNSFLSYCHLNSSLEISRFGFLKEYRGNKNFLLKFLYFAHVYAEMNNYKHICGTMRYPLFCYLVRLGIKFEFIGNKMVCANNWEIIPFSSLIEDNIVIIKKML